ncbi:nif-specific transcriptional activator NifA [Aestuariirhabdus litorea]|uniref:nif-specific transcriptional activator NifA n=1 Tax=Aestuariirhabdus litorea TaxID=2528527 RepID=UPI001A9F1E42|nr:nif-specific transcriptional activator NifA [Aestuariirhabdus litorea]
MNDVEYPPGKQPGREQRLSVQLDTLYRVSEVLNHSLDLNSILKQVLEVLHLRANMSHGMAALLDPASGELLLSAVHAPGASLPPTISYREGEGLTGRILKSGEPLVASRLADEPQFLDRLGLYNTTLPFIGVPIFAGNDSPVGVLAAQPPAEGRAMLEERVQLMEMIANLMGNSVRLAWDVEHERQTLTNERDSLRRAIKAEHGFDNVVGSSSSMRRVFEQVRQVAKWDTTVLIRGQSGTGKELIASAIHYNSPRANAAFVKLNCAALPDNLLESELFGHEKGAFTGATHQHKGRFEQADGGTLFLDEIGEISPTFQAKLLRVLQEGELQRVGGTKTLTVDVRIIAATNRDLEAEVASGDFREDLYYRLNVMPIQVPPLSDRIEDLPALARFLVGKLARRQGRELEINDNAVRLLMQHHWPGNVRELENCLERAAIMSADGAIDQEVIRLTGVVSMESRAPLPMSTSVDLDNPELDERDRVMAALEQAGWVQAKAARLLGMTPRQVAYRIQTLDIPVRRI